jgi:hypothetical protein
MNRIKVVGGLVFILSVMLALLAGYIAEHNREQSDTLTFINEQKAFTQEISKSIFYAYRNGDNSSKVLDETVKKYLESAKRSESEFTQNRFIMTLWNIFYADVQKFRDIQKTPTGYNSVVTSKLVNRIYHNNVLLINQFNKLIEQKQLAYHQSMDGYKRVEYLLFAILIGLLLYLFTQLHLVMAFIQKFSRTSKRILENSTIQGLKPIELEGHDTLIYEAKANYNALVKKIDNSIENAGQSMEQTTTSLEEVARNIEDFMELLSTMQEDESEALFEREDAVIDSLEAIMRLRKKLKHLQRDLEKLTSPNVNIEKES